jgi:hypothetical protein
MLSLANDLVARATRFILSGAPEPALWAVTVHGRVVGSLVHDLAGNRRLTWFVGADPRLAGYRGPIDNDLDALAASLTARLGTPVELQSLPV